MACTLGVGVGAEETMVVGGAFVEGTSIAGGTLAAPSVPWAQLCWVWKQSAQFVWFW